MTRSGDLTGRDREASQSMRLVQWTLVGIVTLFAAALRAVNLGDNGFRIDEGFTLTCARQSWAGVLGLHGYYTLHPPLFFTLVKTANVFVPEVIAARLVAVIAGIATIPIFYAFCRRLLDYRVALGAALLLSISPLHIEFSRDGRMYAPVFFLVTVGWLALISFIQTQGRGWAVLYGASLLLAFYMDYSAVFAVAPQAVVLGVYLLKARGQARWLAGATIGAAIGYLPWLPQVYRAVDRSSGNEGREDWLSASWPRIGDSVLALLGFDGRTVTAGGDTPDAWARWPDLRVALLALLIPVLFVGVIALRRFPIPLAIVVVMILTPPLAAIALSQLSPGYAPRTIMASVLGISILASAFLIGVRLPSALRVIGSAGWIYLAAIAIITLPTTYEAGARTEWPEISDDLASQSTLGKPIIIFSTAGMLTDVVDLYAGDELAGVEIITVQDGEREKTVGYHRWAERGLSLAEIRSGALGTVLPPNDPGKDAVWVILRFGGAEILSHLNALGYQQAGAIRYTDTTLLLFARPGAQLGQAVAVDNSFAESSDPANGWQYQGSRISIRPSDDPSFDGSEIALTEDRGAATFRFSPNTGGLVTIEVDALAGADQARVVVECETATGESLSRRRMPVEPSGESERWQTSRFASICPAETATIALTLQRTGGAEVAFRNVRVQFSPAEETGSE